MKTKPFKTKARSLLALLIAASLGVIFPSGCEKAKHDPSAEAPPAATVELTGDVGLITVDKPDRFPLVAATQYEATSALNVTGSVNPDVSREIPVVSMASGRVVALHVRL